MLIWDQKHKQLLSHDCRNCPDPFFAPYSEDLPHVGCCSYSPVFTLFEIYKMVQASEELFFWDRIYHNPNSTVKDYEIIVHAHVHSKFDEAKKEIGLSSKLEEEDFKLRFSVCQFFKDGKGCGLNPHFKNKVCRSFICPALEDRMEDSEKQHLEDHVKEIQAEVEGFLNVHETVLKQRGWTFADHMEEIVDYLEKLIP